ncbi:MAG: type II toxin-antitoxin system HicB family antitoxin [Dehalococcoidia bacterium]|nr:type II toxin-antitoxin system HicB family antitoxin [Dehalococcoidia bacterium]
MKSYVFKLVIEEDKFADGSKAYHAYSPVLKGCHTWRYGYQEALANIQEAVSLYVDDLLEAGERIPEEPVDTVVKLDAPAVAVNVA